VTGVNTHGLIWLEAQDVLAQARYLDDAFPRAVIAGELTVEERRKVAGLVSLARYRLSELERRLRAGLAPEVLSSTVIDLTGTPILHDGDTLTVSIEVDEVAP